MDTRCMSCMNLYDEKFTVCPHCGFVRGTKAAEPHHMEPETILHKKYIVGKVLGFGGFGVTYIGWDASLNKRVAIKEYLPSEFATRIPGHTEISVYDGQQSRQLFSSGLQSFVEEAQRLAKFNSEGIVGIDDAFQENNTAYIVMEYLDGETLSSYLKRTGPLPYDKAMDVMIPVLQTLSLVHNSGIIHRDISPDNIFITSDGTVKLLDFGSARYATAYNTRSLSVIVKRGYAPPEQYQRHGQQGPWTDNYAAAATLYKMLTGATPEDSMDRVNGDRLAPPSTMGVAIDQGNENALMNALNLSIEKRPQTADQFLAGLMNGAEREGDAVKKDASKFPKWLIAVIAVVAALLIAVGALFATGTVSLVDGRLTFNAPVSKGNVRVPEVLKKEQDEAKELLEENDLEMLIIGRKTVSDKIKKDLICEQNPDAGKVIKKKSQVKVRLSDPKVGYVPGTAYYTEDAARKSFEDEGLKVKVTEEYSDTVGKGGVIKQSDKKDTCKFQGEESEIVISKGPKNGSSQSGTVTIPDLTGKDFEQARKELLNQGVFLLIKEAKYDNSARENSIMSQATSAGSTVNKGENVYVTISLGKEKVRVPNVVYLDKNDAEKRLSDSDLKVQFKEVENDPNVEEGLVLSQSVESGELVEIGSTVIVEYNCAKNAEPADASATQKIEGKILDSSSSNPINNAAVLIVEKGAEENVITSVTTDGNGKYSANLRPGDYILKVSHDNYDDTSKSVSVNNEDVTVPDIRMDESVTTTTISYGTVSGTVVDSRNNNGIGNVVVKICKATSPGVTYQTTSTSSSGAFSARIPSGNYILKFSHGNYNDINRSVTVQKDSTNNISSIKMVSYTTTTTKKTTTTTTTTTQQQTRFTVSGTVSNADNGEVLSGASIKVRSGSNRSGSTVATASSNSSGNYSVSLPNGSYTIEASKSGYVTSYTSFTVNDSNVNKTISIIPDEPVNAGSYRIVLTWDDSPRDIDAHLTFNDHHVYFGNPSSGNVNLDVDKRSGYGPETITISEADSATTYYYTVYNYSGETPITTSGAHVVVYKDGRQYASYDCPTSGSGVQWNVFSISNGQISTINRIQ